MKIMGKTTHSDAMEIWTPKGDKPVSPGEFVKVIPENATEINALAWLYKGRNQRVRPMRTGGRDAWGRLASTGTMPLLVRLPLPQVNLPAALFPIETWLSKSL